LHVSNESFKERKASSVGPHENPMKAAVSDRGDM